MHDFVFSSPNTMEIRGRAKEVGISDLGLLKAEGIEHGAWGYAVGGWRSGPAGLEVGGVEHRAWGPSEMIAKANFTG